MEGWVDRMMNTGKEGMMLGGKEDGRIEEGKGGGKIEGWI